MKKTKKEELKELYGYSTSSLKWVPEGGEILRYIGQDVVFVDFKRTGSDWSSTYEPAKIINISDFDPITMTYKIDYSLESDGQSHSERIIPEGFSFDIAGGGLQDRMNRFIPQSLHLKCIEEDLFWKRLTELYTKRDTLAISSISNISSSKEQDKTLKYACNIGAVTKTPSGDILYFRVHGLKLRHLKDSTCELSIVDSEKRAYTIKGILESSKSWTWTVDGEVIGQLKLIDLAG